MLEVNAILTNHSKTRIKQRVGISKSGMKRQAQLALDRGYSHGDFRGAIKKYLDSVYFNSECKANNIKVFNNKVFLFKDEVLITVLNLPQKYYKYLRR